MTPEELLLKAADEISRTGHWRGNYSKPGAPESKAPVCAYGAMTRAVSGGKTACYPDLSTRIETLGQYRLIEQAAELLAAEIGNEYYDGPFGAITLFNDDPETTKEDVILAMKKAASDS